MLYSFFLFTTTEEIVIAELSNALELLNNID